MDTHVIVWYTTGSSQLGNRAWGRISDALRQNEAAVSAISFWEIGMRLQKGQIDLGLPLEIWRRVVIGDGLIEIPVDSGIAARAGLLENLHGDPADRIIIATALEGHQLITADARILQWSGPLDRLDART